MHRRSQSFLGLGVLLIVCDVLITTTDSEKLEGASAAKVIDVYVAWPHASGGRVVVFIAQTTAVRAVLEIGELDARAPLCVCIVIGWECGCSA